MPGTTVPYALQGLPFLHYGLHCRNRRKWELCREASRGYHGLHWLLCQHSPSRSLTRLQGGKSCCFYREGCFLTSSIPRPPGLSPKPCQCPANPGGVWLRGVLSFPGQLWQHQHGHKQSVAPLIPSTGQHSHWVFEACLDSNAGAKLGQAELGQEAADTLEDAPHIEEGTCCPGLSGQAPPQEPPNFPQDPTQARGTHL